MIHPPLQQVEPRPDDVRASENPGGSFSAAGLAKRLNIIDPLTDTRWDDLVAAIRWLRRSTGEAGSKL